MRCRGAGRVDPTESEEEAVPSAATKSGPPEAAPNEPASLSESIDPIAIGGAVGGMTVGEVIGGAIGGVIGAVAGPGGAVIGAGLGAFAGTTLGAKLGYDVTHELVHPEDSHPNASLGERRGLLPGPPRGMRETPSLAASVPREAHWLEPSWLDHWAARSARSSARPSPASWGRNALRFSMPKPSDWRPTLMKLSKRWRQIPNSAPQVKRSGSPRSPVRQQVRQVWQPPLALSAAWLPANQGGSWAGEREPPWRSISTGRPRSVGNASLQLRRKRTRKGPRDRPSLEQERTCED